MRNEMKPLRTWSLAVIVSLACAAATAISYRARDAHAAVPGRSGRSATPADPNPRTLTPYFTPAAAEPKAPDPDGFLQRWLLLEPIPNGLRSNAGFTESFVRQAFTKEYFPKQFEVIPHEGDKVTV